MIERSIRARGGVDVLCFPQIVDKGGLKSEGGADEPLVSHRLTSMPRPQEIQVGWNRFRRGTRTASCPGTRSGAEASNPTGDTGCLGIAGRRRSVTYIFGDERPPRTRPLQ